MDLKDPELLGSITLPDTVSSDDNDKKCNDLTA
jgi:hypothetical protein